VPIQTPIEPPRDRDSLGLRVADGTGNGQQDQDQGLEVASRLIVAPSGGAPRLLPNEWGEKLADVIDQRLGSLQRLEPS